MKIYETFSKQYVNCRFASSRPVRGRWDQKCLKEKRNLLLCFSYLQNGGGSHHFPKQLFKGNNFCFRGQPILCKRFSSICLFDFVRRLSFSCSGVASDGSVRCVTQNIVYWTVEYVKMSWIYFLLFNASPKMQVCFQWFFSFCSTSLFPSVSFLHKPIKKKHSLDYFCAKFPFITSKDTIFQHLPNCWLIY